MKTQIQYVGPDKVGPHYVEAGLRPDCEHRIEVIAQYPNYADQVIVLTAQYYKEADQFDCCGDNTPPTCWWHLPAAVPATEREWFDAAGTAKGYTTDRWRVEQEWQYRAEFMRPDDACPVWYGEFRETLDEAVTDAYHHWVANGRP